jgi:sugar O-acyltransferase (sialic acid O-acetyltransferase NeuD family)
MPTEPLFVFGAGGHARVVLDAAAMLWRHRDIRVVDDDPQKLGTDVAGHTVCGFAAFADRPGPAFHVAIGDGAARRSVFARLQAVAGAATTVAHPTAIRARTAKIGEATFLAAGCIVGPDSELGRSVIVNHNAVVDHDCYVGDFSHVAPGVVLGGGVRIGSGVLIGAGSTILPGLRVGDGAVIGAGSTIVRDVKDGEKVILAIARKV